MPGGVDERPKAASASERAKRVSEPTIGIPPIMIMIVMSLVASERSERANLTDWDAVGDGRAKRARRERARGASE